MSSTTNRVAGSLCTPQFYHCQAGCFWYGSTGGIQWGISECPGIHGVLVGLAGVSVRLAGGSVGCGVGMSVGGRFVAGAAVVGTDVILGGLAVG